jgi:hypothetical protein
MDADEMICGCRMVAVSETKRVESADRPAQDRRLDPIYGSGGGGFGRSGEAFNTLQECVRLVRDTEFPDDVAVTMIRDAAGGRRAVFHSFADAFTRRDWQGDPLLVHVSDLVWAAQSGTVPAPMDEATAAIVTMERQLLTGDPSEGFELLAARQPTLRDLAHKASDPTWRDEQDRNPPEPPTLHPPTGIEIVPGVWASESTPRLARWFVKRMAKKAVRGSDGLPDDPKWVEFRRSVDQMRSHGGTMAAIGRDLPRLVGPNAESEDPLIKTRVALVIAGAYLREVTGFRSPTIPPRP